MRLFIRNWKFYVPYLMRFLIKSGTRERVGFIDKQHMSSRAMAGSKSGPAQAGAAAASEISKSIWIRSVLLLSVRFY